MRRAELLQEVLKMRFGEVCERWEKGRLTQSEAADVLGVCDRTFRRYIDRYGQGGLKGLDDKRLSQASYRLAPVDDTVRRTGF